MATLNEITAGSVDGRNVSLNELLYTLKITDRLGGLRHALDDVVIDAAVATEGIEATPEELQQEADALRRTMGLLKAADTQAWLDHQMMSVDDFEEYLRRRVTTDRLKERMTADRVEGYFAKNRPAFDAARLSRITVVDASLAEELAARVKNGGDFAALALEHSTDEARLAGGDVGLVYRYKLPPAVAAAVFRANEGDVVGPVNAGGRHQVVRIEEIRRAALNREVKAIVRDLLFADWLAEQRQQSRAEFALPLQIGSK